MNSQAIFFKAFDNAEGDVGMGRLVSSWKTIHITMHAKLAEQRRSEGAGGRERPCKRRMDDFPIVPGHMCKDVCASLSDSLWRD